MTPRHASSWRQAHSGCAWTPMARMTRPDGSPTCRSGESPSGALGRARSGSPESPSRGATPPSRGRRRTLAGAAPAPHADRGGLDQRPMNRQARRDPMPSPRRHASGRVPSVSFAGRGDACYGNRVADDGGEAARRKRSRHGTRSTTGSGRSTPPTASWTSMRRSPTTPTPIACSPRSTAAITCTPTSKATPRWPTPWT
jgi:hypothetical protein